MATALGLVLTILSFAPAPPEPPALPPEVAKLAQGRLQAALKAFDEAWVYYKQARTDVFDVFAWSKLVLESQAELSQTKEEYVAALGAHRDRMRELDALVKKVRRVGFAQSLDVASADYFLKDAEYRLARGKAQQ
ncbi:MAG: hypothetical protein P4L84_35825 [Isosphaeraceae bacterium]|nr:hypothetical protein [Isosphaeraceae bacterium]